MILFALWLTKKNIRKRQSMNVEQTLFYTDASNRRLHEIFVMPAEDMPAPKSQDMLFAEQLNEAILKNMSNPNLNSGTVTADEIATGLRIIGINHEDGR